MSKRTYEIVVYGASGFTGKLVAEYLARSGPRGLRWAVGGRSQSKLEAVAASVEGEPNGQPGIVLADSSDYSSLKAMCEDTHVVLTTVGPYHKYGRLLTRACAQTGTDYVDLTGEGWFIRDSIAEHNETARRNGAALVHCCGFDSVPSDLGTLFAAAQAAADGDPVVSVSSLHGPAKGGFSGGTAHSGLGIADLPLSTLKDAGSPAFLVPPGSLARQPRLHALPFRGFNGKWAGPFIMASINRQVVLRSQFLRQSHGDALADQAALFSSDDFTYDEHMQTGSLVVASVVSVAMVFLGVFFGVLCRLGPVRWAAERFLLPSPGTGPSKAAQRSGFFSADFRATTKSGKHADVRVAGTRDPGYSGTAVMIAECALTLARDRERTPLAKLKGGVLTPAAALGFPLIDRLNRSKVISFSKLSDGN